MSKYDKICRLYDAGFYEIHEIDFSYLFITLNNQSPLLLYFWTKNKILKLFIQWNYTFLILRFFLFKLLYWVLTKRFIVSLIPNIPIIDILSEEQRTFAVRNISIIFLLYMGHDRGEGAPEATNETSLNILYYYFYAYRFQSKTAFILCWRVFRMRNKPVTRMLQFTRHTIRQWGRTNSNVMFKTRPTVCARHTFRFNHTADAAVVMVYPRFESINLRVAYEFTRSAF